MTQYVSTLDRTSPFSDLTYTINLEANTAVTITVPGTAQDQYRAQFSWAYNANVYVGINTSPVLPSAGTINQVSNVEFRPGFDGSGRFVRGGDVLHFLALSATSDSGISLLKIPN